MALGPPHPQPVSPVYVMACEGVALRMSTLQRIWKGGKGQRVPYDLAFLRLGMGRWDS